MDSIKQKCKNCVFLKNCQFSPHPSNCGKVGRVQLSSNFFLLSSLISHSHAKFEQIFFKKIYTKSGKITEKKNKTWKDF